MTVCIEQIRLHLKGQAKPVDVSFDGPKLSSDGGFILLRKLDDKLNVSKRIATLLPDERDPKKVRHSRQEQLRQRLYQITHGYEDQNDASSLRHDPVLKSACGLASDESRGLSSQPTLSRFENCVSMKNVRTLLLDFERYYIDSLDENSKWIVLDIDTSDDPTHGQQQLTFFHGYYGHYMVHPMFIFSGLTGQLVSAILRPGNASASRGSGYALERIIRQVREKCPNAQILVRGDCGFSVPRLHQRLERLDDELSNLDFLLGQFLHIFSWPLPGRELQSSSVLHCWPGQEGSPNWKVHHRAFQGVDVGEVR